MSSDKKLRIGIVGCGAIARQNHIPAFAEVENCSIEAVCDVSSEVAEDVAHSFEISYVYESLEAMLESGDVQAVVIATPNNLHELQAVAALRAGCHVLCEKPLGRNAQEAQRICDAAEDSGLVLQVGLQLRFMSAAQLLKSRIDAGEFGEIYYARCRSLRRRGVPTWGNFIDKERQGGGPLIDTGIHMLDLTWFLMGCLKPVSASGMTWDMLGKTPGLYNIWGDYDRDKFDVEDMAVGLIRFENGSAMSLESSFMANISENTYGADLMGSEAGACLNPGDAECPLAIYSEAEGQLTTEKPSVPKGKPEAEQAAQAFVESVLEGKPSPIPGTHGLALNKMIDAIYASAESGREETIEL